MLTQEWASLHCYKKKDFFCYQKQISNYFFPFNKTLNASINKSLKETAGIGEEGGNNHNSIETWVRPDLKVSIRMFILVSKSYFSILIVVGLYVFMKSVLGSEIPSGLKVSTMYQVDKRLFES